MKTRTANHKREPEKESSFWLSGRRRL